MGEIENVDLEPLTQNEYLFIKMCVDKPNIPKWKVYHEIFGGTEKNAKSNATKLSNRPKVKRKIDALRIGRDQSLSSYIGWDKNRLVYELEVLARRSLEDGHPVFHDGLEVGAKPDYSTARACISDIGKVVGAFEADQKIDVTLNLGEYFKKRELE